MADPDESNRLGARVRRYAQVSAKIGGFAARAAGGRLLGVPTDHGRAAAELTAALGGLKGPLMKVAQILSTIPDALPTEYSVQLAQLQSDAPRMGWPFVKRRMATELGAGWQAKFQSFEHEAAHAASLGQVHRAVHPDGRRLACKLQYPDMQAVVEADLRQLQLIFSVYRNYDKAIDTSNILAEIGDRLREELDYLREAKHMRLYGHMLRNEAAVCVPEMVPELTTGRLLTMTWLDGQRVLEYVESHQDERNQLARNMFRAWYVPFYDYGVIHGDPHLGNYTVRGDLSINLLDFGAIRVFSPAFVQGVIDLYRALDTGDRKLAVHAYETWGFTNLSDELIEVLNLWAGFVYGPVLDDRTRPIQEGEGTAYGRDTAVKVQSELRRVGGVKPPREFVLMDRAAVGLGSVFLHLRAEINWYELFHELAGRFDRTAMEQRQAEALAVAGLA